MLFGTYNIINSNYFEFEWLDCYNKYRSLHTAVKWSQNLYFQKILHKFQNLLTIVLIFGISMANATKSIQTIQCLVQWFLRLNGGLWTLSPVMTYILVLFFFFACQYCYLSTELWCCLFFRHQCLYLVIQLAYVICHVFPLVKLLLELSFGLFQHQYCVINFRL